VVQLGLIVITVRMMIVGIDVMPGAVGVMAGTMGVRWTVIMPGRTVPAVLGM